MPLQAKKHTLRSNLNNTNRRSYEFCTHYEKYAIRRDGRRWHTCAIGSAERRQEVLDPTIAGAIGGGAIGGTNGLVKQILIECNVSPEKMRYYQTGATIVSLGSAGFGAGVTNTVLNTSLDLTSIFYSYLAGSATIVGGLLLAYCVGASCCPEQTVAMTKTMRSMFFSTPASPEQNNDYHNLEIGNQGRNQPFNLAHRGQGNQG